MIAPVLFSAALLGGTASAASPSAASRSAAAARATSTAAVATTADVATAENPKVTALAKEQFAAWQAGKIDRKRYTDAANGAFSDATVEAIAGQLAGLGDVDSVKYVRVAPQGGNAIYTYLVTCGKGKITMTLGIDAANKISAIGFKPVEPATTS